MIAIVTGVAGSSAVLYGLMALATAKIQKVLCVCSFGLFSVLILAYFIVISVALLTVVIIPEKSVADFCNGSILD
jgi:cell shape-determining protein MreD